MKTERKRGETKVVLLQYYEVEERESEDKFTVISRWATRELADIAAEQMMREYHISSVHVNCVFLYKDTDGRIIKKYK